MYTPYQGTVFAVNTFSGHCIAASMFCTQLVQVLYMDLLFKHSVSLFVQYMCIYILCKYALYSTVCIVWHCYTHTMCAVHGSIISTFYGIVICALWDVAFKLLLLKRHSCRLWQFKQRYFTFPFFTEQQHNILNGYRSHMRHKRLIVLKHNLISLQDKTIITFYHRSLLTSQGLRLKLIAHKPSNNVVFSLLFRTCRN